MQVRAGKAYSDILGFNVSPSGQLEFDSTLHARLVRHLDHGKSLGFVKVSDLAFSHSPDDHYEGLGKIVNRT